MRGLMRGTSQDPIAKTQTWVKEELGDILIDDWIPAIFQTSSDGSKIVGGTARTQNGQLYAYRVVLTKDNDVVSNQSSVVKGDKM
jgi:hypothetical protein